MTYTPIAPGALNWDVPVNAAFVDQDTRITANAAVDVTQNTRLNAIEASAFKPSTAGWISWNFDPALTQGSTGLATGVLMMARVDVLAATTISTLNYAINALGVGLTSGQNLVGLYDASGNLVGQSTDQTTNWGTTGFKGTSLITPYSAAAGTYHLGFLSNAATTPVSILRSLGSGAQNITINANLSAAAARFAQTGAGLTALPSTVTMSGRTLVGGAIWVAVS